MTSRPTIRLGTRGSALARTQAEWVQEQLSRKTGAAVELIIIATSGDQIQEGPISRIGSQGVFTRQIQQALRDGEIDLAVHSLKDLPTEQVSGLTLAAVPERAPAEDALVSCKFASLDDLPPRAKVGTGSLRRRSQLLHLRGDLEVEDIRGNVDTRLRKLEDGQYDAILLAAAGLTRLGLADRITERLLPPRFLPAVGQGALGLETREDDETTRAVVTAIDDPVVHAAVDAERTMLAALEGGCLAPIAGHAELVTADNDHPRKLQLQGRVVAPDGSIGLDAQAVDTATDAAALGKRVAEKLLQLGAADLIRSARDHT